MKCLSRLVLGLLLLLAPVIAEGKIPEDKIKIGVLAPTPAPFASELSVDLLVPAQLAAGDFAKTAFKLDAKILPGPGHTTLEQELKQVTDWLNKEGVAAVLSSAGATTDHQLIRLLERHHRTLLLVGGVPDRASCSSNAIIWGTDPATRARALVQALVSRGDKRWFVLADASPSAVAAQLALRQSVAAKGGDIVGTLDQPPGEADLSAPLQKIRSSHADVVALAENGPDLVDVLREIARDGLPGGATAAAPVARLADIDNAGPAVATGLVVASPFYWDSNQRTRDFARRFAERAHKRQATQTVAEVYAAVLSFLDAAKAADDVDANKVLLQLRQKPLDTLLGKVAIDKHGRAVRDLDIYRVKRPDEVRHRWDYYAKITSVPGVQAFGMDPCEQR